MCTSQIYAAQVQVLGYSTKAQTQLGLRFVLPRPKQLRRPSAWRAHTPQVRCILSPSWSQPLGFLGVQLHLRCAVCLFWGADLWLRPSQQMSTVQNPKKSWLAMKPACSLVADATLGPRLPSSSSGCPASLSLAGDGLVRSWLALLSPLFCEWAWRYLRLGLFAFSWDS